MQLLASQNRRVDSEIMLNLQGLRVFAYLIVGRGALVLMLLLTCLHCESASSKRARERLAQHPVVAAVDVEVKIIGDENFLREGVQSLLNKVGLNLGLNKDKDKLVDRIRAHSVQTANQHLAAHGMQPVQRRRIQAVLKELALSQAGLTEQSLKIGRLVKADSIFTGTLTLREKKGMFLVPDGIACLGDLSGSVEIVFSGEITSVERGVVLYAGTVHHQADRISMYTIEQALMLWFEKMPVLE